MIGLSVWHASRHGRNLLRDRVRFGCKKAGRPIRCSASQHAEHGNLITVRVAGSALDARESLSNQIKQRLGSLTIRNEIVWD